MTKFFIALTIAVACGAGYFLLTTPPPVSEQPTDGIKKEHVQKDMGIHVDSPAAMQQVDGVTQITGDAHGSWFFEGSFPIVLLDAQSNEVAYGVATAEGEWMTDAAVPFAGEIDTTGLVAGTYFVMLKKDNPSGLPENDAQTSFPIVVQ